MSYLYLDHISVWQRTLRLFQSILLLLIAKKLQMYFQCYGLMTDNGTLEYNT